MEEKAQQIMELMSQFFTLAKLESGDMSLAMEKVNLSELCRETMLGFYEILVGRDFSVEVSVPETDIFAVGDKDAIERILCNLISNAIRYGSDGNYIGLSLRQEGGFDLVDVADQGKGIEKEFAASVFQRLYTMEDSRNRNIQGNGLGLTIARNLARQMGGDVLLESKPNVRTVFTIKLKGFPQSL